MLRLEMAAIGKLPVLVGNLRILQHRIRTDDLQCRTETTLRLLNQFVLDEIDLDLRQLLFNILV